MIKNILLSEWSVIGYAGLGLLIIGRLIDDEKLKAAGLKHGRFMSKWMGGRMGRRGYEKLEAFFQTCGFAYFKGLWDGLDEDDKSEEQQKEIPKNA